MQRRIAKFLDAHTALVFAQGRVEYSTHRIFNTPVRTYGQGDQARLGWKAANVVAALR